MRISDWSSDVCSSDLLLHRQGRARVVRGDAAVLRGEAEGHRDVELRQRLHLAIEPGERAGTEAVGPAQAGAQMPDTQASQPSDRVVQPVILALEPLADSHLVVLSGACGDEKSSWEGKSGD